MGSNATVRAAAAFGLVLSVSAFSQTGSEWRRVGNAAMDLDLADLATGPVSRTWYSADGSVLFIQTGSGKLFQTSDFDTWQAAPAGTAAPVLSSGRAIRLPESGALVRNTSGAKVYALASAAYRSDDNGANWDNLTTFRSASLLGTGLRDLAVSPRNEDELVVVGDNGAFRSVDGGRSWAGLNDTLPNLPLVHFRSLPNDDRGVRVDLENAQTIEWPPGERQAWRPADSGSALTELRLKQLLGATAITISSDYVYGGLIDGRIRVSSDGGSTWQADWQTGESANAFWVDTNDPRTAIAVLDHGRVLFSMNGGAFWIDISANLPDTKITGVTADRAGNAVYVATEAGVYWTRRNFALNVTDSTWTQVAGLPPSAAMDVRLDPANVRLWVAIQGYGVYQGWAPHRNGDPKVVSAADLLTRAAAPGAVFSVVGARVNQARMGDLPVPVLVATDTESQIQIPFGANGTNLPLSIDGSAGPRVFSDFSLQSVAPAIIRNPDGSPLIVDGDTGVLLDAMHPAHSNSRIRIFATGLGQLKSTWQTGSPGPVDNPPEVAATVSAYLDRSPVRVTQKVLGPFIGYYIVEIEIPNLVNYGPAELYIDADGQASNRVRVYIEP